MHDTDERSMRELLARGAAGGEPPLGSLLGDVVRAGFRARRRRRIASAGGALGAAAVLAAGITAGIGHAPWQGRPGAGQAAAAGSVTAPWTEVRARGATVPSWFRFAAPQAPHQGWTGPRARTTAKSGAELLLGDVAAGTKAGLLQGTLKNLGNELGVQVDLRGPAGKGSAEMQMSAPGGRQPGVCDDSGTIVCRTYHLPGGTRIQEDLSVAGVGPAAHEYILSVLVMRPDRGVSATFTAMNYFVTGNARGPASTAPPVRMATLVAAAQDLRWGWTMNSGFVAHAQHLRLGGDSGQAWH
jgi:hypothetical protein